MGDPNRAQGCYRTERRAVTEPSAELLPNRAQGCYRTERRALTEAWEIDGGDIDPARQLRDDWLPIEQAA
jgi:hypothetical protein